MAQVKLQNSLPSLRTHLPTMEAAVTTVATIEALQEDGRVNPELTTILKDILLPVSTELPEATTANFRKCVTAKVESAMQDALGAISKLSDCGGHSDAAPTTTATEFGARREFLTAFLKLVDDTMPTMSMKVEAARTELTRFQTVAMEKHAGQKIRIAIARAVGAPVSDDMLAELSATVEWLDQHFVSPSALVKDQLTDISRVLEMVLTYIELDITLIRKHRSLCEALRRFGADDASGIGAGLSHKVSQLRLCEKVDDAKAAFDAGGDSLVARVVADAGFKLAMAWRSNVLEAEESMQKRVLGDVVYLTLAVEESRDVFDQILECAVKSQQTDIDKSSKAC